MRTIYLIRHGATQGNIARRYIGCTDEPLCDLGFQQAQALKAKGLVCDYLFSSPLKRALQTAGIAFDGKPPVIIEALRECDFGNFVGRTADEMKDDPEYRAWVGANCEAPVPGGEDVAEFKRRCVNAFLLAVQTLPDDSVSAFVSHGGNIMAILENLSDTSHSFFEFYPKNCEYVKCVYENGRLTVIGENI